MGLENIVDFMKNKKKENTNSVPDEHNTRRVTSRDYKKI